MDNVKDFRRELTKMFVVYTLAVAAAYFAIIFFELGFSPGIVIIAILCVIFVYFRERLDKYIPPGNFLKYYLKFCYPFVLIDTFIDLSIGNLPLWLSLLIQLAGFAMLYFYMYIFYAAKISVTEAAKTKSD